MRAAPLGNCVQMPARRDHGLRGPLRWHSSCGSGARRAHQQAEANGHDGGDDPFRCDLSAIHVKQRITAFWGEPPVENKRERRQRRGRRRLLCRRDPPRPDHGRKQGHKQNGRHCAGRNVLYAEPDKTLAGVANFLSDPGQPINTTLNTMMTTAHLGSAGPHPVIASAARELLNKSDNERFGLYRDPLVAKVTSRCDWRIRDLVEGSRPATLYLVVPPSDISRTKPLVRLILNQIGRRLTEDLHAKGRRHRLLLMLDEFPALGRLDFFESALAFMAGYGLKSFLIAQSLNQIEKAYGPNNSILDNCPVRVCFATNDERTRIDGFWPPIGLRAQRGAARTHLRNALARRGV